MARVGQTQKCAFSLNLDPSCVNITHLSLKRQRSCVPKGGCAVNSYYSTVREQGGYSEFKDKPGPAGRCAPHVSSYKIRNVLLVWLAFLQKQGWEYLKIPLTLFKSLWQGFFQIIFHVKLSFTEHSSETQTQVGLVHCDDGNRAALGAATCTSSPSCWHHSFHRPAWQRIGQSCAS